MSRSLIRLALSMPPRAAAGRAAKWMARRMGGTMAGWWARRRCSYPETSARVLCGLRAVPPVSGIDDLTGHWLNRRFNLLGSGWVTAAFEGGVGDIMTRCLPSDRIRVGKILALIDDPAYRFIDWHLDFKSGYRWSARHWGLSTPYGHRPGVDVKVPWELARMGHLLSMAQAYAATSDPRLAKDVRNQILDFSAANPPGWGVNWACPMDVAIRIATILTAYDGLVAAGWNADEPFQSELAALTLAHGRFIRSHLEAGGNHLLADLCGLILAGSYLSELPETAEWVRFALPELDRQILIQFQPDGSNYEASTAYHRLSLEMVQKSLIAAPSATAAERLHRALQFAKDCTMPSGRAVQIGDNDSGRFLNFDPRCADLDFSHLWEHENFAAPACLPAPGHPEPGGQAKTIVRIAVRFPDPSALSGLRRFCYPDFGLYGWKNERCFISFRCGSIGQNGRGGHAHNDQLAMEIEIDGEPWAQDPGSFTYTADLALRDRYRSVLAHFAPRDGGKEPARMIAPFQLEDRAQGKLIAFDDHRMAGWHRGFVVPVMRDVTRTPGGLIIEDRLGGSIAGPETAVATHEIFDSAGLRNLWALDIPFSPGYGQINLST